MALQVVGLLPKVSHSHSLPSKLFSLTRRPLHFLVVNNQYQIAAGVR